MLFWLTDDIGMLFFQIEGETCNGNKNVDDHDDSNKRLVSLLSHPSY